MLYDSITKVAGVMFFVSAATVSMFKLFRKRDIGNKEVRMKPGYVVSNLKIFFANFLIYILGKAKIASSVIKRTAVVFTRFLYRSRTKVLFITTILLATLLASFLLAS
jgi:hypothetical protein